MPASDGWLYFRPTPDSCCCSPQPSRSESRLCCGGRRPARSRAGSGRGRHGRRTPGHRSGARLPGVRSAALRFTEPRPAKNGAGPTRPWQMPPIRRPIRIDGYGIAPAPCPEPTRTWPTTWSDPPTSIGPGRDPGGRGVFDQGDGLSAASGRRGRELWRGPVNYGRRSTGDSRRAAPGSGTSP